MMLGVVALGLIGAAYTLWYEDLKLNVDVSTGTLNADWSLHDTDPNTPNVQTATEVIAAYNGLGPVPAAYADFLTTHPAAKYTQTCGANIGDWEAGPPDVPHANDDDDNLLNLSMTGLYPYAGCKFSINIHSTGSVPIHLALESVMDNTGGADINVLLGPGSDPRCQALLGRHRCHPDRRPWTHPSAKATRFSCTRSRRSSATSSSISSRPPRRTRAATSWPSSRLTSGTRPRCPSGAPSSSVTRVGARPSRAMKGTESHAGNR